MNTDNTSPDDQVLAAYFNNVTSEWCTVWLNGAIFWYFLESGGVPSPASSHLRVCEPGYGTIRVAQRPTGSWRVHQGRVCAPNLTGPHPRVQTAGTRPGRW